MAIAICAAATAISLPLGSFLGLTSVALFFLLIIFLVAWKLGQTAGLFTTLYSTAMTGFLLFPDAQLALADSVQALATLFSILTVGLMTAHYTAALNHQARIDKARSLTANRLYELARDLAGAFSVEQVEEKLQAHFHEACYRIVLHLNQSGDQRPPALENIVNEHALRQAIETRQPVSCPSPYIANTNTLYLPLIAPTRVRGVMSVTPKAPGEGLPLHTRDFFVAVASLIAIAVERLHYVDIAQHNRLQVVTERLRSAILSALSHDIRTPLTILVGLAERLAINKKCTENKADFKLICDIRDQARAMSYMVNNLLDMARLYSGGIELRREWQLYEDVIGASLQMLKPILGQRLVKVSQEPGQSLVNFDAVVLERAIGNLIENAAKYSPPEMPIEIHSFTSGEMACISVRDYGAGFAEDRLSDDFDIFKRVPPTQAGTLGSGLGLSICRAIVEAHAGTIKAENAPGGGAIVTLCLPRGVPPVIEKEFDVQEHKHDYRS